MPATFNLHHLEKNNLHLEGQLHPQELDLNEVDELIHANEPLIYKLDLEKNGNNVLATGKLHVRLDCECARCLAPFKQVIEIDPWAAALPLTGEEAVPVVNDLVDLTPLIREDTLLALPQRPLCGNNCKGLKPTDLASAPSVEDEPASAWAELNKLKLK